MRKRWTFGAAVVLAGAAASTALATIPSSDGVIHGCFKQFAGTLRLVEADEACGAKERPIAWNARGPKGDTGPAGPQGPAGLSGPAADFGTGAGLEKLEITAPPPIGDQTVLQIQQSHRLPQGCSAGAVPQRSGNGWVCGSGSGPSSHAYVADIEDARLPASFRLSNFTFVVTALVDVPAGSYVVVARAGIQNLDLDSQDTTCKLNTPGFNGDSRGRVDGYPDNWSQLTVTDAATFAEPATLTLSCATFDGLAFDPSLIATRVAGIN